MKVEKKKPERLYAIFRKSAKTGLLEGYIEYSFSMDWSNSLVRVWRESDLRSSFKDEEYKQILDWMPPKQTGYDIFLTRINSKKCPAEVIMDDRKDKFYWRNKRFSLKIN